MVLSNLKWVELEQTSTALLNSSLGIKVSEACRLIHLSCIHFDTKSIGTCGNIPIKAKENYDMVFKYD